MKKCVSDVQIIPIKPKDGLVAFVNIVYDDSLFLGSIAIYTRPGGEYRLVYPKKNAREPFNIFHPINKITAKAIDDAVIEKYKEVVQEVEKMSKVI